MKANEAQLGALAAIDAAESALPAENGTDVGAECARTRGRRLIRPAALQGIPIPGGRSWAKRKWVYLTYELNPHLRGADYSEVSEYVDGMLALGRMQKEVRESGGLTRSGEVRKLLDTILRYKAEQRKLAESLGLTTVSKVGLGVKVLDAVLPFSLIDQIIADAGGGAIIDVTAVKTAAVDVTPRP